jgi:Protein of unknown function (DUF3096)
VVDFWPSLQQNEMAMEMLVCPNSYALCLRSRFMGRSQMPLHPAFGPAAALIAGILILIMPRLLNYIVAIYLIIIGILGLLNRSM